MSNNGQIPGADIPLGMPGATDSVLGVDEASRAMRRFPRGSFPLSAADEARLRAVELGQSAAMLGFATKAAMDASLAYPDGTLALVTNDGTAANNGTYRKIGASGVGSWVLSADRVTGLEASVGATNASIQNSIAQALRDMIEAGVESGIRGFATPAFLFSGATKGAWIDPQLPDLRNLWQYTEELAHASYGVVSAAKGTETTLYNQITLTRLTASNFYGALQSNFAGLGLSPFVPGELYLLSFYAKSSTRQFVWMRSLSSGGVPGFGAKLLDTTPRRIWVLARATSTNALTVVSDAAIEIGGQSGSNVFYWLHQGSTETGALDIYVGGFQIERLGDSEYRDGIAMIGDSTMEGSSGSNDSMATNAREVSVWLGAHLNVNVFNRANGGERTDTMDARWATDISPIAPNCKYAIIQGGINDISQGRALASIKASILSMVSKAKADGLIPLVLNCTPTSAIASDPLKESDRVALNDWIERSFANAFDIATVVADPANPSLLNPAWAGDGVHYTAGAKEAIADYLVAWSGWDFVTPSEYQKVTRGREAQILSASGGHTRLWKSHTGGEGPTARDGHVIGIIVDRASGEASRELVSNGHFSVDTSGWTALGGAALSAVAGELAVTGTGDPGNARARTVIPVQAGKWYRVSCKARRGSSTSAQVTLAFDSAVVGVSTALSVSDDIVLFRKATATGNANLDLYHSGTGTTGTAYFDDVSVLEMPGNHAIQSTPGSRPIFRSHPDRVDFDTVDDALLISFPEALGDNCTIGRAVPGVGAQILTRQSVGTSYALNSDTAAEIILNRGLTPSETAILKEYLNRKAGV